VIRRDRGKKVPAKGGGVQKVPRCGGEFKGGLKNAGVARHERNALKELYGMSTERSWVFREKYSRRTKGNRIWGWRLTN